MFLFLALTFHRILDLRQTEVYPKPSPISKVESFAKNNSRPLTVIYINKKKANRQKYKTKYK